MAGGSIATQERLSSLKFALNPFLLTDTAVKHAPFTAIESPIFGKSALDSI